MITVVPVDENKISNHFSKAEEFVFLNENGEQVKRMANPVLNAEGCHGRAKRMLVEQLASENPDRIVVRDLGECMLRKLLAGNFKVFRTSASALFEDLNENLVALTEPDQGRTSRHTHKHEHGHNHEHGNGKGHGHGGSCCGKHKHGHDHHGKHQHGHGGGCGCHH